MSAWLGRYGSTVFFCTFAVAFLCLGSACKKKKPKELKRYGWVENKLGGPDSPLTCDAELKGATLTLDFDSVPAGTTITIRGKDYTPVGKLHLDLEMGDAIGVMTVKDVLSPGSTNLKPGIPIALSTPTGSYKTEIPEQKYISVTLRSGLGKPMKLGTEPAPSSPPNVMWLGLESEALGNAKLMRDVDWIASESGVITSVPGPMCKYQDPQTGAISSAPLKMLAPEIAIYDRRTGRIVDKKNFYGLASCPSEKSKKDDSVASTPSEDTIKRWLNERRTKK
jgi:hypothetical protein